MDRLALRDDGDEDADETMSGGLVVMVLLLRIGCDSVACRVHDASTVSTECSVQATWVLYSG